MQVRSDLPAREFLRLLVAEMDRRPRDSVLRRHEAMIRELSFRSQTNDEHLAYIRSRGWSNERLSVLFALNCVYQEVLGPLHASARAGAAGLGTETPIRHGSHLFGPEHSRRVILAVNDFFAMITKLGFERQWMSKNTCGDLVFSIERQEREREQER
jgi:hypothetical protein